MRNISLKMVVVLALAFVMFGATSAFADGIDVSAVGGTYTFSGATGSVFSTTDLGAQGVSAHRTSPTVGSVVDMGNTSTISFSTGTYNGDGTFAGGGAISYSNLLCGGVCFTGSTTSSQFVGSQVLVNFTTNTISQGFATLLGVSFTDLVPNATGVLSITLDPSNNQIASADYVLTTQTPEPASLLMLGSGLLALGGGIRRKLNLI